MSLYTHVCISPHDSLEMSALDRSPGIEAVAIKTNTNAAYHLRKQRELGERMEDDYELMSSPSTSGHNMLYTPTPYTSYLPFPDTRPPVAPPTVASDVEASAETEGMYESIRIDK